MSPKIQALVYGAAAGVSGYIAYFIALPPSLQTGIMGQVIGVAPPSWQPALAGTSKTLSVLLGIYATYKAAHGSQTSPPTVTKT